MSLSFEYETAEEAMARNTAAFIKRLRDEIAETADMHEEAHSLRLVREQQDG